MIPVEGLPHGTVTFVFTDIEGSTRLLQATRDGYPALLERHQAIISSTVSAHGGVVMASEGDGFFLAFQSAVDAVAAAAAIQRQIAAERWPEDHAIRVRIGLHTGEGRLGGVDYVGIDVHRAARIGNSGHGGQIVLSEPTARLVEYSLPDGTYLQDLGTYSLKDLANPEHLYQLSVADLPATFPRLRSTIGHKGNLPRQPVAFIGRRHEVSRVTRAVQEQRLVTLTGPAGIGKTTLALAVADEVSESFPDGVWYVEVSRLTDAAALPPAIARVLKITENPSESLYDTLTDRLTDASLLLVFDGCEGLVGAAADIAEELLRRTESVHVLVTSRELLAVRGEMLIHVGPLSVPDPAAGTVEELAGADSVALFVDRARLVQPDFALTPENAAVVAEICRRLDGIPLAIELAAARLTMLSLNQLLTRLDQRFAILTEMGREHSAHQQTLEATLDWSYQGLSTAERALFARLSVFSGGFTLDLAEDVCAGGTVTVGMVLQLLGRLVETSMCVVTETDPVRYRLLEPIAQYARMRLEEDVEDSEFRRRHAQTFLALAEEADLDILGAGQTRWVERLDRERYNLRSALETFVDIGDNVAVLRLAGSLGWFWIIRRDVGEGVAWLDSALADRGDAPPDVVARALAALGVTAIRRLELDRAESALREARELYRSVGDRVFEGRMTRQLGTVAWFRDDPDEADALAAEASDIGVETDDGWGIGWSLALRGTIARLNCDLDAAHAFLEESHRAFESIGGVLDLGWSLLRLGALARDEGAYELATRYYQDGRARLVEANDTLGVNHADAGLAAMEWLAGHREQSLGRFASVLEGYKSEEASANLFELKTMIQGNPSTDEVRQIVETNRRRAGFGGRDGAMSALAEYLYHIGRTALRRGEWERASRAFVESLGLAVEADQDSSAGLAVEGLAAGAAGAGLHDRAITWSAASRGFADRGWRTEAPQADELVPLLSTIPDDVDDPLRARVAAGGTAALRAAVDELRVEASPAF